MRSTAYQMVHGAMAGSSSMLSATDSSDSATSWGGQRSEMAQLRSSPSAMRSSWAAAAMAWLEGMSSRRAVVTVVAVVMGCSAVGCARVRLPGTRRGIDRPWFGWLRG